MAIILPAILAKDEAEFVAKVARVRSLGLPLHIDVMDGTFTPQTCFAPADRMKELLAGLEFDAHLMVSNPEHAVPVWLAAGARRVLFHTEATSRDALICRGVGEDAARLGITFNPDSPISRVTKDLDCFGTVMVMGVTPGKSGQPFEDIATEKVRVLRDLRGDLIIMVDGGVRPSNVRSLVEAGADVLVAGSALTDAADPAAALLEFKKALGEA
ncbi:MAG: ribulose-phosphate 3-epimerase [Candidatus Parcubacteria bacterium]|jgi:ribulose-phosphate 3-epimerase